MSVRGVVGVVAVLVVATVAVPSSIVVPNTSRDAVTGVRSVSAEENDAAAQHWTTDTQAAATPVPTSNPAPTTTAAPVTQDAAAPTTTDAPAAPTPDAGSTEPLGPGVPTVGALFTVDANGLSAHYCTASVVDSPAGDLVITAAHCIHNGAGGDYRTDIA
ncbi:MAG TPA: hypothetical protein VH352_18225, partial [Pseudonocardiaceae bacterium]|nr:hypothetical protein [Pseudonocardiaceae bacterium]